MKAVVIEKPFKVNVKEVPKPKIKEQDEVLIRVICGGICGSDLAIYKGTNSLATYPRIMGHEFGGIVEEIGNEVKKLKIGDYVAVDPVHSCGHCYACTHNRHNVCSTLEVNGVHIEGGFAEYAAASENTCYKVDTTKIAPEFICMVEPYSIGVEVRHRGRIEADDKVLVMGSGPIGVSIMQVAKGRGAQVMMTDLIDLRLNRAKEMGADVVVNVSNTDLTEAVFDFTDGEGIPVVVDTVCSPKSFEQAISLACPAGRVVTLGVNNKPSAIAQVDIMKKELDILGSRLSNYRFPEAIIGLEAGLYTPEKMRSSEYHFTETETAIKKLIEHPDEECKITLSFDN